MYHFNFLKKYRTFVPTYKYDFVRFSFNSFIFGFILESYLIFFDRYSKIYKTSFTKELEKARDWDNKLEDKRRKKLLIQKKLDELNILEEKLKNIQ
jgi:hypothetical protein